MENKALHRACHWEESSKKDTVLSILVYQAIKVWTISIYQPLFQGNSLDEETGTRKSVAC